MKIIKQFLIGFLLVSIFNNSVIKTDATDSPDQNDSETDPHYDRDGLLYANGGTWIQGADGRWWYRHSDGSYTTNDWEYINGKWYYFDADGWMVTGWIQLGNTWYYLKPSSGEMVTNFQLIDGYWYYFNSSGAMYTGWLYDTNTYKRYYFESNGHMHTGWLELGVSWYYMDSTGEMVTGWKYINSYWYYFTGSGIMNTGWLSLNNKDYYMDDNGHMVTGWQWLERYGYYYSYDQGRYMGYYNYFNGSGELVTDSDAHMCSHVYNTFYDHKNLKGITLKYYINPSCNFGSEIVSAANNWNTTVVSLSRIYSSIPTADILLYNSYDAEVFYGRTYYYYYPEDEVFPTDTDWNYCRIALKSENDMPLATITHEFGHAFGLSHRITKQDSIMQYNHNLRSVSTPQPCDVSVVTHLY